MTRSGSRRARNGSPVGRRGRPVRAAEGADTLEAQQVQPFFVEVQQISQQVITECEELPAELTGGGLQGGILCTGFFDVEKLIKKFEPPGESGQRVVRMWLVEKKLPFQTLFLDCPTR